MGRRPRGGAQRGCDPAWRSCRPLATSASDRRGSGGGRQLADAASCAQTDHIGRRRGVCEITGVDQSADQTGSPGLGFLDELEVIDVLEFAELHRRGVRRGPRGLVGEPAVGEDLLDDVGLGGLDETDYSHRGPARGTSQWIDVPDALDQGGNRLRWPRGTAAPETGRRAPRRRLPWRACRGSCWSTTRSTVRDGSGGRGCAG